MYPPEGSEEFGFGSDTFDSREVIARIKWLEDDENLEDWEQEELTDLKAFAEEAEGYISDWSYGEQFISDNYFVDFAEELARDIGAVNDDSNWPNNHIDWEAAADELKQDYTSFTLRGNEYWAR